MSQSARKLAAMVRVSRALGAVDASVALAQSRDPLLADTLVRQITAADLIVVNKVDVCDSAQRSDLHRWSSPSPVL